MKTLVEHLIYVRDHLSDKERYQTNWINNKVTGYTSGSLGGTLAGIWNSKNNSNYVAAHHCVAMAIEHLYGSLQMIRKVTFMNEGNPVPDSHFAIIHALEERKYHSHVMKVLDLAIRYAKLYAFS
jgi:hypothetical protein